MELPSFLFCFFVLLLCLIASLLTSLTSLFDDIVEAHKNQSVAVFAAAVKRELASQSLEVLQKKIR